MSKREVLANVTFGQRIADQHGRRQSPPLHRAKLRPNITPQSSIRGKYGRP
jgi:hypothetical protein